MFDPVCLFASCTVWLAVWMGGWLNRSGCPYFQARKRVCLKGSSWTSLGVYVHVSSCFVLFIIYVDMPADMPAWLVACLLAGWFACVLGRSEHLFFGYVNKCVGRFSLLCCIALLVLQVAHILCQQCVGQHWTTNSYQFASTMSAYLRGDL